MGCREWRKEECGRSGQGSAAQLQSCPPTLGGAPCLRDDARPLRTLHRGAIARVQHLRGRQGSAEAVAAERCERHPQRPGPALLARPEARLNAATAGAPLPSPQTAARLHPPCCAAARAPACMHGAVVSRRVRMRELLAAQQPAGSRWLAAAWSPPLQTTRLLLQLADAAHAVPQEGTGILHVGHVVGVAGTKTKHGVGGQVEESCKGREVNACTSSVGSQRCCRCVTLPARPHHRPQCEQCSLAG